MHSVGTPLFTLFRMPNEKNTYVPSRRRKRGARQTPAQARISAGVPRVVVVVVAGATAETEVGAADHRRRQADMTPSEYPNANVSFFLRLFALSGKRRERIQIQDAFFLCPT